jgi:hypothetical protein
MEVGRRYNGGTMEGQLRDEREDMAVPGWRETWDAAESESGRSVGRKGVGWF